MVELLKENSLVEYRFTKNGKWREGKIIKVEVIEKMKVCYAIAEYSKGIILDWDEIKKMCNNEPSGELFKRDVLDWYFIKWFSPEYVRTITDKQN